MIGSDYHSIPLGLWILFQLAFEARITFLIILASLWITSDGGKDEDTF